MQTFNFGLTVNFGPETLQAVNRFLELLKNESVSAPAKNGVTKLGKEEKEIARNFVKEEKTNGQETTKAIVVTLEQLREKFSEYKTDKDKRPKCAAILKECGVTSVSNIPVAMYAEVYEKINQL